MRSMKPKRPLSPGRDSDVADLLSRRDDGRVLSQASVARWTRQLLTPRQGDVAALLVGTGLSYKQIAARLDLSEGTVRTHTERIYRAFGVHSRPELTVALRAPGNVPSIGSASLTGIAVQQARQGC
jgi:DNA-binding NarL/FixJ family response regulator